MSPSTAWRSRSRDTLFGYDPGPVGDLARRVNDVYDRAYLSTSPMMNFDEVDLTRFADEVGFVSIDVDFHIQSRAESVLGPMGWQSWLAVAPNPLAPTFGEAISTALDADQQLRLEQYLRPLVESDAPTKMLVCAEYAPLCFLACMAAFIPFCASWGTSTAEVICANAGYY